MAKTVISVENLSKTYRLGQLGTGTFTNDLKVWWARKLGKPNPLLKIGQVDLTNQDGDKLWALKDVSFQVEQGEVLGIIGRNGAGKSTLLKILSRVTAPTSGCVKVKGRIASLLEVGTGFHPELTGRENIYLNGAILGMTKAEVRRKFDEIVAFAEIEKFVDTPVKRYSSGMYVRLAFAVAAHLDSEILLVDEVLAVGDGEFQKKCLGKMGDVASKEGRTVLFVSHNMAAIISLCQDAILLTNGSLGAFGTVNEIVNSYFSEGNKNDISFKNIVSQSAIYINEGFFDVTDSVNYGEIINLELGVIAKERVSAAIYWKIKNDRGVIISVGVPQYQLGRMIKFEKGRTKISIKIGPLPLFSGRYSITLEVNQGGNAIVQRLEDKFWFEVLSCDPANTGNSLLSRWNSGNVVIPFSLDEKFMGEIHEDCINN